MTAPDAEVIDCVKVRAVFKAACFFYHNVPIHRTLVLCGSLQVERLSKSVVARRAELQNLEAESSAKQVGTTEP